MIDKAGGSIGDGGGCHCSCSSPRVLSRSARPAQYDSRERRLDYGLVLLLFASLQAGCATNAIWAEPTHNASYGPELVGIAREGPPGSANATELVFRYHTAISPWIDHAYYIALPLGKHGEPPTFLAFNGSSRTPREVEAELSNSRAAEVRRYVFPSSAYDRARIVMRSLSYAPVSARSKDAFGPEAGALLPLNQWGVVVGYRPDGTPVGKMDELGVERFPQDCYLLLLPYSQPRPVWELRRATALAYVLTPFAMAFDIATFPVQIPYFMTHR